MKAYINLLVLSDPSTFKDVMDGNKQQGLFNHCRSFMAQSSNTDLFRCLVKTVLFFQILAVLNPEVFKQCSFNRFIFHMFKESK